MQIPFYSIDLFETISTLACSFFKTLDPFPLPIKSSRRIDFHVLALNSSIARRLGSFIGTKTLALVDFEALDNESETSLVASDTSTAQFNDQTPRIGIGEIPAVVAFSSAHASHVRSESVEIDKENMLFEQNL